MLAHIIQIALLFATLLLLGACDSPQSNPTENADVEYLTEEIPPCTPIPGSSVDPCEPRGPIETFGAAGGSNPVYDAEEPLTIRQFLDGPALTYIPHIVLRGTYIQDTVRCTSGDPNRVPSYVEPGYFQHSILINCYADVRVNGYILGKGPSRLTVLVYFHHYWEGYYAPISADDMTEQEAVESFRTVYEMVLEEGYDPNRGDEGIYGREVILFVGTGHSHAHEVWEVVDTWYVHRREDGTVIAVHPHRDDWKGGRPDKYREHQSTLEVELPRFKVEVLAAHQARVTEYDGRITSVDTQSVAEGVELPLLISDIHSLDEFLVSTGAYDHPDGTPAQPPPVPGEGDPVQDIGVDDSTPVAPPPVPGGEDDSTLPPTPTLTPTPTPTHSSEL